ncbi:hypothetical protein Taro_024698, partial [Colocasia esculenta]|nr:hypothetical protein [Colocasia esculenta]
VEAEDLAVNNNCRQVHQQGHRRPYPLTSTSHKRQSMLPPAFGRRNLKWLIEEIEVVEEMIQRRVLSLYLGVCPRLLYLLSVLRNYGYVNL